MVGRGTAMATNYHKYKEGSESAELRKQAGLWLRDKREAAGLSQRQLANALGFDYYTFISQIESGKGKLPSEHFQAYAKAVNVEPREFALSMLRSYDPHTYKLLFDGQSSGGNSGMASLEERLRKLEARLAD